MKALFIIAVISSIGYLAYQEFPLGNYLVDQSKQISAEVMSHDQVERLKQALKLTQAEAESLRQLLAQKEPVTPAENGAIQDKPPAQNDMSEVAPASRKELSKKEQRRQSLIELAERMELHSLGLVSNVE
ncbi:MAG: hypothetical protein COA99_11470 [Moraxellaceae bacterium]|nr:MAG: hypothetical protein COA99_11470 [Moraxellaceae bacterium]